jgi:hypothetical protein
MMWGRQMSNQHDVPDVCWMVRAQTAPVTPA